MPVNPWARKFYQREGEGVGFDRVVFFSDAVFAIAITLMALEIGTPEVEDPGSVHELWQAISAKGNLVGGFIVAFAWVAIYWRANHKFTSSLRRMSSRYVGFVLVYLGLVAILPFPAGMLGEYWQNPVSVVVFAVYGAMMSGMEVVLFVVADRDDMFLAPLNSRFRRMSIAGSLTPVASFLVAIPIAFLSTLAAVVSFFVVSVLLGIVVNKAYGTSEPFLEPAAPEPTDG